MKVRLGDVCEKGNSNIVQKDLESRNGEYPIYGATGLIKRVDFYKQEKDYIAVVKDGAGVGRTMLLPAYSSVIGTMQYIFPKENILTKFLYYTLQWLKLERYYKGAAIPHIYFSDYKHEEIFLPTKEIQQIIVTNLDKLSLIIEKRKQQLEKLDLLIKSKFIEMFGLPNKNQHGWVTEKLVNHLEVIGGYAFKSDNFKNEGIPVLRIGNINSGRFQATNLVFWQYDESLEKYIMHPGDLVISLTGTVGKDDYANVCILGNDYEMYYLNQRNARLKLKNSLNKLYLAQLLKFPEIKSKLTNISRGVRQANVANQDILNLSVPVPPIELQNEFARFVEQTDSVKLSIKHSLNKLETLKRALMQKYFE